VLKNKKDQNNSDNGFSQVVVTPQTTKSNELTLKRSKRKIKVKFKNEKPAPHLAGFSL